MTNLTTLEKPSVSLGNGETSLPRNSVVGFKRPIFPQPRQKDSTLRMTEIRPVTTEPIAIPNELASESIKQLEQRTLFLASLRAGLGALNIFRRGEKKLEQKPKLLSFGESLSLNSKRRENPHSLEKKSNAHRTYSTEQNPN